MSVVQAEELNGSITNNELCEAFKCLVDRCQHLKSRQFDFSLRELADILAKLIVLAQEGQKYLSITRPLHISSLSLNHSTPTLDEPTEIEDPDEAAIHHAPPFSHPDPTVEYHIIHSPTYRVPVLYFYLHNLPPSGPKGIDAVYEYLISAGQRDGLKNVGVMGGLAMINHPLTGIPCFWAHPCNTNAAVGELVGARWLGERITAVEYFMLWLGLAGAAVGLHLPKAVALVMGGESTLAESGREDV